MKEKERVLVTGAAGFIGYHLSKKLLDENFSVIGIDNLNDYYDPKLKTDRLKNIQNHSLFQFFQIDLKDHELLTQVFMEHKIDYVINLAAQAGVRYSIENPSAYIGANLVGFANILELSKNFQVKHFIYASSSSVYGANRKMPFSVNDNVDHPISLYAATKKSNELIAHSYASIFNLPVTGLRFFTVYGPWGRSDMALFLFTKAIVEGKPIDVFNNGKMERDFTYVGDIVEGVFRLIKEPPSRDIKWDAYKPSPSSSYAPSRIYNIGNGQPIPLLKFIEEIESQLGIKAKINFMELQAGDVPITFADTSLLEKKIGYKPSTSLKDGISDFINWYTQYYGIKL